MQALEFGSQRAARSRTEIVLSMGEHDGSIGAMNGAELSLAQFRRAFPRTRSPSEGHRCAYCLITFGHKQCELSPKRMAGDSDSVRIDPWLCFQQSQRCHHIIELVGCQQHELQVLTGFLSFRFLLATQDILHEWCLAGGRTMTSPKRIEKRVAVLDEKWSQNAGCLRDRHPCGVVSIRTS